DRDSHAPRQTGNEYALLFLVFLLFGYVLATNAGNPITGLTVTDNSTVNQTIAYTSPAASGGDTDAVSKEITYEEDGADSPAPSSDTEDDSSAKTGAGTLGTSGGDGDTESIGTLEDSDSTSLSGWQMFRRNLNHTGYYPGDVDYKGLEIYWDYTGDRFPDDSSAVSGEYLFYTDGDGNLTAINTTNGNKIWVYASLSSGASTSPTYAGSRVYFGQSGGNIEQNMSAVHVADGQLNWTVNFPNYPSSHPLVYDDKVYFLTYDGVMRALNTVDGSQVWSNDTGGSSTSSPAFYEGRIYIGGQDNLTSLNASTGAFLWTYRTRGSDSSPAVAEDRVIIGLNDNNITAFNATDGTFLWGYPTGNDVDSSPAIADGVVYFGCKDDNLYALNATDGTQIGNFTTNGDVDSSPAVTQNSLVFFGNDDGEFYAVNASNISQQIFRFDSSNDNDRFYSPAIADGYVYVNMYDYDIVISTAMIYKFGPGIAPNVSFEAPTTSSGGYLGRDFILANVTAADRNLRNVTIYLFNSSGLVVNRTNTSVPYYVNISGLGQGTYYLNATAYDNFSNYNYTETKTIVLGETCVWEYNQTFTVDNNDYVVCQSKNMTINRLLVKGSGTLVINDSNVSSLFGLYSDVVISNNATFIVEDSYLGIMDFSAKDSSRVNITRSIVNKSLKPGFTTYFYFIGNSTNHIKDTLFRTVGLTPAMILGGYSNSTFINASLHHNLLSQANSTARFHLCSANSNLFVKGNSTFFFNRSTIYYPGSIRSREDSDTTFLNSSLYLYYVIVDNDKSAWISGLNDEFIRKTLINSTRRFKINITTTSFNKLYVSLVSPSRSYINDSNLTRLNIETGVNDNNTFNNLVYGERINRSFQSTTTSFFSHINNTLIDDYGYSLQYNSTNHMYGLSGVSSLFAYNESENLVRNSKIGGITYLYSVSRTSFYDSRTTSLRAYGNAVAIFNETNITGHVWLFGSNTINFTEPASNLSQSSIRFGDSADNIIVSGHVDMPDSHISFNPSSVVNRYYPLYIRYLGSGTGIPNRLVNIRNSSHHLGNWTTDSQGYAPVNLTYTASNANDTYDIYINGSMIYADWINITKDTAIIIQVDTPPVWSLNQTDIFANYDPSARSFFNITWQDDVAVSTAWFESNYSGEAANYSMNNITADVYNYSEVLPGGMFYWKSYANDTIGQWNQTDTWLFSIAKASSDCFLEVSHSPTGYSTQTQANCTCTNLQDSARLWRNGTDVTASENGTLVTLAAGDWYYVCNVSSNKNYTSASNSSWINITRQDVSVSLLINGSSADFRQNISFDANMTCTANVTGNLNLTQNQSQLAYGASPLQNISIYDTVGDRLINCSFYQDQNFSAAHDSSIIYAVDEVEPQISIITPLDNDILGWTVLLRANVTDNSLLNGTRYEVWNGTDSSQVLDSGLMNNYEGDLFNATLYTNDTWPYNTSDSLINSTNLTFIVYANDTSGNLVNASTYWTLDNSRPSIQYVFPTNNTFVNSNFSLEVFMANHQLDYAGYNITNASGSVVQQNFTSLSQATYTFEDLVDVAPLLPDGNYTLTTFARDFVGNNNTKSVWFYVDKTIPNATVQDGGWVDPTPANNSFTNVQTQTFNMTCNESFVDTVWLDFNGTVDSTPTGSTGIYYWWTVAGIGQGTYTYTGYCNDTAGNNVSTETRTLNMDTTPPYWSSNRTDPESDPVYSPGTAYQFNMTWEDNYQVSNVYFAANFTGTFQNYSISGSDGSEYYRNFNDLGAGYYVWQSWADDAAGNQNFTDTWTYVIQKSEPACYLTLAPPSPSTFGTSVTASCYCGKGARLYRNGSDVTAAENATGTALAAGYYLYSCNVSGSANYTSASNTSFYQVNKAASSVTLLINGSSADFRQNVSFQSNKTCVLNNPAAGNVNLTQDGVRLQYGAAPQINISSYGLPGDYLINCSYAGSSNYNASFDAHHINATDEEDPIVTLEEPFPGHFNSSGKANITFNCSATDNFNLTNISLFLTDAGNHTFRKNQSSSTGGRSNHSAWTVELGLGNYTWNCLGFDSLGNFDWGDLNRTVVMNLTDLDAPPYWSNNATSIATAYSPITASVFLINWSDDLGLSTAWIELNYTGKGLNHSMTNVAGENYTYSRILPAGLLYWRSYANDTSGQWNQTSAWVINIAKAVPVLSLNSDAGWSFNAGTQSNVTCTADTGQPQPRLWRDGVNVSNPDIQTLAAGTYTYVCNATESQNYTSANTSRTMTVSPAPSGPGGGGGGGRGRPECRDYVDNDGDGLVDWPDDPGCSSSNDDNETDCQEYWTCKAWTLCNEQGMQYRKCTDQHHCGTNKSMPITERSCTWHCEDGILNNGEQGIDCGGPCISCCENGILNRGEKGIDCGGPCPPCPEEEKPLPMLLVSASNPVKFFFAGGHYKPRSEISNMAIGQEVKVVLRVMTRDGDVVAESVATFEAEESSSWDYRMIYIPWMVWPGLYDLEMQAMQQDRTASDITWMVIVPWWAVLAAALAVELILLALYGVSRRRRRKEKEYYTEKLGIDLTKL
ncbi:PQQ-binding-like beta-propeller repeat protein, partial [Candidatus Woesearchaeota archaeon]|nr:PQQ-binding-like beta-propeller repeat protein [Candidatus Woesearchaeota archaeon]